MSSAQAKKRQLDLQFLLHLVRIGLGVAEAERSWCGSPDQASWRRVLELAELHGVVPLIAEAESRQMAVPRLVRKELHQRTRRIALRNLFLAGELHRLITAFAAAGVRALPFKGPTLAVEAYGGLPARQFLDLDILVAERDFAIAMEVLNRLQYRAAVPVPARDVPLRLRRCRQISLLRHDGRVTVELHTDFFSGERIPGCDFDRLWQDRKTTVVAGIRLPTLSREELLLCLCIHGANHLWSRLEWICDLAALLADDGAFDWPRVVRRAGERLLQRRLLVGLQMVQFLVPAHLPARLQYVPCHPVARSLAAALWKRLLYSTRTPANALERVFFQFRFADRLRDGLWRALHDVLAPRLEDYEWFPLAHRFHGLAYVVRLARLACKYLVPLSPCKQP